MRYYNLPIRWKHTPNFNWTREAWSHTVSQIHRDDGYDEPAASFPSYIPDGWNPRVEGYTTYNYNVTWTGIERLKLGFGIKNLFNQDPQFTAHQNDFAAGAGWEPRIADPRGRAYTFLVEYDLW